MIIICFMFRKARQTETVYKHNCLVTEKQLPSAQFNGKVHCHPFRCDRNATRLTGRSRRRRPAYSNHYVDGTALLGVAMVMYVVCVQAHSATRGPDAPATDAHRCKHQGRSTALHSTHPTTLKLFEVVG
ncbi:uncharacterized protein LOC128201070 [Galleria mellonella]|uniref:Uncharacterized protein LOC128201070 n=1 Tax=Galleria mellonella TaxID=7137 RepID=A0ABM3MMP2_GALME|nr:uncharacterized protein LOC128201070 [Galleria mellonella]